ncbi:Tetratricopeptide repeat protein 33 [Rhynchospora pubera]|uniref:Tetratricopeptide repeat protein 33 n=1 Tax=Rhynchospora pubera TaxID=906938 RepID=A0AAV8FJD1_9POAL|nr:Tetratricopeptide repeat protein 33 [Rhynchospora pubera]
MAMKMVWKSGGKSDKPRPRPRRNPHLPFDTDEEKDDQAVLKPTDPNPGDLGAPPLVKDDLNQLFESLQSQGNHLAEAGKYREALSKWEGALNIMPENEIIHEQKAQVLLELGDAWNSLKAATRATQLKPSWPEAWVTLGRAQLNYGEPDSAIDSFDKALALKADYEEAKRDRQTAMHLVQKRKLLHSSGLSANKRRFVVADKVENSLEDS